MDPFEALLEHYPETIAQMPEQFDSHAFILRLASRHQALYVQALAEYPDSDAPFKTVHGRLAKALHQFDAMVTHEGTVTSTDIFGDDTSAALWRKR